MTVEGTVRRFNRAQFERDYNWFSTAMIDDADELQDWERDQRAVIVARSVRTDAGRELVGSGGQNRGGTGGIGQNVNRGRGSGNNQQISSLRNLVQSARPTQLVGNAVDLRSVQVQRVVNPTWIMVGTAQEDQVLVRLSQANRELRIGDTVNLTGVVRDVPDDLNRLGINQRQLSLAEQRGIYIQANRLNPVD